MTSALTGPDTRYRVQHPPFVRNEATFCLPLLLIKPVALSSRMLASTNGNPVKPVRHASNRPYAPMAGEKNVSIPEIYA